MAKREVTECDLCGSEVDADTRFKLDTVLSRITLRTEKIVMVNKLDVCASCAARVVEALKGVTKT